ncbi:MAG: plasmid recombination protein [Clostridiales bacterium]|nr:plasmid recombination protein [Clostridiales bacterium]
MRNGGDANGVETEKVDRTVVRNQSYKRGGIGIRERHNERKNEHYANPDIEPERSPLNVHFRRCDATYEQKLAQMLEAGEVSTRGLKEDAKIFEEMVFDVNTAYFERHGGYDYAKAFFGEVFRFAEKEVGSPYILSAVMHADERNKGLSEKLGKDVYHYHLHVIYLPVVDKEVKWSKRCRDPTLVGKTKDVIHQISHSKKWAFQDTVNEKGETRRMASYSLLQTRFFNHMRDAGFTDFERGVEGSTAEHQEIAEYKVSQERVRLKEIRADTLESEMWLDELKDRIRQVEPMYRGIVEVEKMGKKKRFSDKVELTAAEFEKLTSLAKFAYKAQHTIEDLSTQLRGWREKYFDMKSAFERLQEKAQPFIEAMREVPETVISFLLEVVQKAKEAREQQRIESQRAKEMSKLRAESPWRVRIDNAPEPPKQKPKSRDRDAR